MIDHIFPVQPLDTGERIDRFLCARKPDLTRSSVQLLISQGLVQVNGREISKNFRVSAGETVVLSVPPARPADVVPQNIPLDVVYEDGELLVVNKPQGMVVHPAAGNAEGTLVNALLAHCGDSLSGINGVLRPGIVHRIDKDTSGLLLVAKTNRAHLSLAAQLKAHSILRLYRTVVHGVIKEDEGRVEAPIGRSQRDRKRMAVVEKNAKNAVTNFRVLERFEGYTYVECRLETGRTHQIRVHLSHIGHPVAGDPVYGPKKRCAGLSGQCLHAAVIGFVHPVTEEWLEFESPLPDYFKSLLTTLRDKG